MKIKGILFITLVWYCIEVSAQNKQLLYDFSEIPQSLLLNPGTNIDFDWYAGIPMLSGLSLQVVGSSGISVNDIFAADGLDINDKIRARALNGMSIHDEFSGTYQIELISGGFRGSNRNNFYSFGIYNESDAIAYWLKDYALLAFDGNAASLDKQFNLGHLKTRGELVNVFHFGVNKRMNKRLTLGVRGKLYSSIFDFNSTKNKGHFVTSEGQNNLLATTIDADLQLRSSGFQELSEANKDGALAGAIVKRGFFGGNLGLGVDLGFSYSLNEHTMVTASLLDVGVVYHSKDVNNYSLNGRATIEGVEIILPEDLTNVTTNYWQELVDEVEALVPFENSTKPYFAFRPTKLNASIRYGFGERLPNREVCECGPMVTKGNKMRARYINSIGGQLYIINRPRGPQTALTAFYLRRFGNGVAIKTSYTVDKFSINNIGIGLNLQLGVVNLYVMGDNLLAYKNVAASRYASFQLGLNIISWGKK